MRPWGTLSGRDEGRYRGRRRPPPGRLLALHHALYHLPGAGAGSIALPSHLRAGTQANGPRESPGMEVICNAR